MQKKIACGANNILYTSILSNKDFREVKNKYMQGTQEISQVGGMAQSGFQKKRKQTLKIPSDSPRDSGNMCVRHVWLGTIHSMLRRLNQLLRIAENENFTRKV